MGGTGRMRRLLVGGQVAAAVVVLVGTGLVARSLARLHAVDLGLVTDGVMVADLHGLGMIEREADEAAALYRRMLSGLAALEGVEAVGGVDIVPLGDNRSCDGVEPLDRPPPAPGEGSCAEVRSVTPGLLEALGLPLLAGRTLSWSDGPGEPGAMVLSRTAAQRFWPGAPDRAMGARAVVHGDTFTVVGVVGDVLGRGPAAPADPHLYLPATQEPWSGIARGLAVVVRGRPDRPPPADAVRDAVLAVDPREPIVSIRPMDALLGDRIAEYRFRAALMRAFALLVLALAAVGLAGTVGTSVAGRRREFGVRLALGARGGDLTGLALRETTGWIVGGSAAGLLLALPAALAGRSLLFGVQPWDPAALLAAPLVLAAVVGVAAWIPARRAARLDPVDALRPD